jgi:hypothetical protein
VTTQNFRDMYKSAMTILTGEFPGRAIEVVAKTSKAGDPQLVVKLQIEGGPNRGRVFTTYLTATPTTQRRFFGDLKSFGMAAEYFDRDPAPSLEDVARDMVGRPVMFTLKEGAPYNGQTREEVSSFKAAGPGAVIRTGPVVAGVPDIGTATPVAGVPSVDAPVSKPTPKTPTTPEPPF